MRRSGIKAYFSTLEKVEVDPKVTAVYEASIAKVVPEIVRKLREKDQCMSDMRFSRPAAAPPKARAKASPGKPKNK